MSAKETRDGSARPGALGRGMDALMGDDEARSAGEARRGKEDGEPEKNEGARREKTADAPDDGAPGPEPADRRQDGQRGASGAGDGAVADDEGATIYLYDRSPFGSCPARLIASGAAGAVAIAACVLVGVKAVLSMERSGRLF